MTDIVIVRPGIYWTTQYFLLLPSLPGIDQELLAVGIALLGSDVQRGHHLLPGWRSDPPPA